MTWGRVLAERSAGQLHMVRAISRWPGARRVRHRQVFATIVAACYPRRGVGAAMLIMMAVYV